MNLIRVQVSSLASRSDLSSRCAGSDVHDLAGVLSHGYGDIDDTSPGFRSCVSGQGEGVTVVVCL